MKPEIRTYTGKLFNFVDPTKNVIDIMDIAHGLSNICRFAGHTVTNFTVAQHSVWCSDNVEDPSCRFAALMHDAHEAYVGDCPTPLKMLLPDYKLIENTVQWWVLNHFRLPSKLPPCVKEVDQKAYIYERDHLMRDECGYFSTYSFDVWSHSRAKMEFLKRFNELRGELNAN